MEEQHGRSFPLNDREADCAIVNALVVRCVGLFWRVIGSECARARKYELHYVSGFYVGTLKNFYKTSA